MTWGYVKANTSSPARTGTTDTNATNKAGPAAHITDHLIVSALSDINSHLTYQERYVLACLVMETHAQRIPFISPAAAPPSNYPCFATRQARVCVILG